MKVRIYIAIAWIFLLFGDRNLAGAVTRMAMDLKIKTTWRRGRVPLLLQEMVDAGAISNEQRKRFNRARRKCSAALHGGNPGYESVRLAIKVAGELSTFELAK